MLFALITQDISFEFRPQTERFRWIWDLSFAGGSLLATLCQGFILGGLISGVAVRDGMFAGGTFDFFTLLGLLCGVGLVGGYGLLGSGWLVWKTNGPTQLVAREVAHSTPILTGAMMLLVSAWSVPAVAQRWFACPRSPISHRTDGGRGRHGDVVATHLDLART